MEISADSTVGGTIVVAARSRRRLPTTLTWLAVTPFAAWAVARVAGLERGSLPTQLMTATPYVAAGSLLPLLVAAVGGRRAATAVALIATTALGVSVLPRALGTADATAGRPMRVLTLNMLFGKADPQAVMDLVHRLDPDVLSTQELTPGAVEELDALGLKTLMPNRVLQAEWSATGSGLFSKYPMEAMPELAPSVGHNMPAARISLPGGKPIEFLDVHPFPPLGRQAADWSQALGELPAASTDVVRVLAGDFNASLDHASMRGVLSRGYKDAADEVGAGLIPTWPANKRVPPIITIDHVLVDRRVAVREVSVHTVPGTDHRAVFAELAVP
ncbi:endonuclease/exonuclease/phosphatase family protein [Nonomuraea sp. 3-1Str]|uniref:endonuclease/exonuclease/phosphatase family protein n=1 Tax=Nonomuraea sp. 3-1Str TaxID=2929801 RepID=UPI00285F3A23|nr:endonuclease/exonuclease/phosphatase family protein [Nonomuraea sp. 3-1Str]MDR8412766.1 endonuclease/exonuclease/phosphatase family protein [Nonomuraea sp. 3-1Str]